MKKLASLFVLSLLTFGIKAQTAPVQGSDGNWQPVIVASDGSNSSNGVEINYQLSTANGSAVVLVELINRNPYSVKAQWKDQVITKDGQTHSGNTQESVTIAAKLKLSDDDANTTQITIKLNDFQASASNFKSFTVSNFNVTK